MYNRASRVKKYNYVQYVYVKLPVKQVHDNPSDLPKLSLVT